MPITAIATVRRAATAALLVTATLALTAGCHDGTGPKAGDSATAVSPAPVPPSAHDDGKPPTGPDGRPACTPEMLKFQAGAMPRRAHRMLLTVTNFSDRPCTFAAQPYPLLHFGDDRQPPLPAIGSSAPPTVVTLTPNRTAYALITTSAAHGPDGTHRRGRKVSQFGVALSARATPTQVGLDGRAPVHVDPHTARVTYWQSSLAATRKW
ncbi:DUF4232 domain-containing protein [Streptomyces sp. NPDC127097]|uniref:DUF4232 domain-containing protein n=1 Tax=Streptomyces sp. NPDC127097 TaxID=3347136 RepID=UPI0036622C9E